MIKLWFIFWFWNSLWLVFEDVVGFGLLYLSLYYCTAHIFVVIIATSPKCKPVENPKKFVELNLIKNWSKNTVLFSL